MLEELCKMYGLVYIENKTQKNLLHTYVKAKIVEVNDYDMIATLEK